MQIERKIKQILDQDIRVSRLPLLSKCYDDQALQSQAKCQNQPKAHPSERTNKKIRTLFLPRTLKRQASRMEISKFGLNKLKQQQQRKFQQASRSYQNVSLSQQPFLQAKAPPLLHHQPSTYSVSLQPIYHTPALYSKQTHLSRPKIHKIIRNQARQSVMKQSSDSQRSDSCMDRSRDVKKGEQRGEQRGSDKRKELKRSKVVSPKDQTKKSQNKLGKMSDEVIEHQTKFVKRRQAKANTLKLNIKSEQKHKKTYIRRQTRLHQFSSSEACNLQSSDPKSPPKAKIKRGIRDEIKKQRTGLETTLEDSQNIEQERRIYRQMRQARKEVFSRSVDKYEDLNQINLRRNNLNCVLDPLEIRDCLPQEYDFTIQKPQNGTYFGDVMIPFQLCKHSQFPEDEDDFQEKQMSYFLRMQ